MFELHPCIALTCGVNAIIMCLRVGVQGPLALKLSRGVLLVCYACREELIIMPPMHFIRDNFYAVRDSRDMPQ